MIDLDAAFSRQLFEVRYDSPKRRCQRTANKIASGGNQNPTNDPDPV